MHPHVQDPVEVSWSDRVAVVTLNRPDALNAIDASLAEAAAQCIVRLGTEASAIMLRGKGRAFSAGGDLRWFHENAKEGPDGLAQRLGQFLRDDGAALVRAIRNSPIPVVCAINGACVGGAVGLVLSADLTLASHSAYFLLPQASTLGIVPDLGGTWGLPRAIGRARSLGMSLLGDRVTASQAQAWGLIWQTVDDAVLFEEALDAARRLAAIAPGVVAGTRQLVDASFALDIEQQLDAEAEHQEQLMRAPTFAQACARFLHSSGARRA